MSIIDALIIGIVQGLTEYLPVSSSGHIELVKAINDVNLHEDNLLFSVIVHAATALSTVVIFWKDIIQIFKGLFKFKWNTETQYVAKIVISMVPVIVAYLFFKDDLELLFEDNILLVGLALLGTALLLFFTFFRKDGSGEITYATAFIIGVAQAIAITPGISRSGATIAVALLLGIQKVEAARFSFLMVLIPIFGATALELKDYFEVQNHPNTDVAALGVGFAAAFIAGLLACKLMLNIVKRGKLYWFGVYCAVVGILAIAFL